jgi:hypothetical protein
MKNSMGDKIQTYRETKKDWNRNVGFKPITGWKYKCTEKGCPAKVTKKWIDAHDNMHNQRDNSTKVISRFTWKVNSLISSITSLTSWVPMYRQRSVLNENWIWIEISKLQESVSKHTWEVRQELDKILKRVINFY